MRIFWMVLRFTDQMLRQHPDFDIRNIFYLSDVGKRGDINPVLFPSLQQAESHAIELSRRFPMETVIVLEQKFVYELPELPQPIKKRITANGEIIPDE